jgi:endonuclease YncB( thermonuclease family)
MEMAWFILILVAFFIVARVLGFYKKDDSENYLINRPWVQCHEIPPRHAFDIKVLKVITGNSLLAEIPKEFLEEKKESTKEPFFILRLNHIETPEHTQRGGRAAVLALEGLFIGKKVKAVFQQRTDYFEESFTTLYAGDRNVNLELTANGLAWINKKHNQNQAYWKLLQKAQIKGFGIWSLNRNIPPWKYRKYRLSNEQRQR